MLPSSFRAGMRKLRLLTGGSVSAASEAAWATSADRSIGRVWPGIAPVRAPAPAIVRIVSSRPGPVGMEDAANRDGCCSTKTPRSPIDDAPHPSRGDYSAAVHVAQTRHGGPERVRDHRRRVMPQEVTKE